jgi:hypothetical protein
MRIDHISRVKPAIGFRIEVINGIGIGARVEAVEPSKEYLNLFRVKFEGSEGWFWVLYLQRTCDA